MKAITMLVNSRKIKSIVLTLLLVLTAILGGRGVLYVQEFEAAKEAAWLEKYAGVKDPREKCISELLRKEENPSLWKVRSCLKKKASQEK